MTSCPDRSRFSTALLLAACIGLAGCEIREGDETDQAENEGQSTLNLPSLPRPQAPLDRAALLTAVARASSATASGIDDSAEQRALAGSAFELRIRFGCRGPAPELGDSIFGWTFDRENGTLRLRATPTLSAEDEVIAQIAGDQFETVEGFWIPRPWLLDPVCPAAAAVRPAPPEPEPEPEPEAEAELSDAPEVAAPVEDEQESESPPPAWPKVGIAQFFTESDPRTRQRGMRPYETVKTITPGEPISAQGYNLVLSGRLRALPGQRVIACVSRGADNPPDCIVSARIDRVRLERPDTKEILAEWGSS